MGNGNPTLTLDGEWDFYKEPVKILYDEVPLETVTAAHETPLIAKNVIEVRSYGTVLNLGEMDLSGYAAVEILYCSDANAKLGDVGSYFALAASDDPIRNAEGNRQVLAKGILSNATGPWSDNIRTVTIDVSSLSYSGAVYLPVYMGDFNGVNIVGIRLIRRDEATIHHLMADKSVYTVGDPVRITAVASAEEIGRNIYVGIQTLDNWINTGIGAAKYWYLKDVGNDVPYDIVANLYPEGLPAGEYILRMVADDSYFRNDGLCRAEIRITVVEP